MNTKSRNINIFNLIKMKRNFNFSIIIVSLILTLCTGCGSGITLSSEDEISNKSSQSENISVSQTETSEDITFQTTTKQVEVLTDPVEHRDGMNGISDKLLSDDNIRIDLEDSVRNDKTGNWKLIRTSDIFNLEEYALDYYKTYFKNDDEVHAIVNFTMETTSCVTCVSDCYIDVTIHEYVEKEEHDADMLFSGDVINEYFIYIDNGDIEKIR